MSSLRRDFLKLASAGLVAAVGRPGAHAEITSPPSNDPNAVLDVKAYGARGDGITIDTPAINQAIAAANARGGGTVRFPPGIYACYSIHLKSKVILYLEPGATILAASVPVEGATRGAYDAAESNQPWENYQDYGHNHWHNSLIWGENLHDFAILGTGLIWGKGLSRGASELPLAETAGMGNKAIGLKNCRNVILRDFSVLEGGHFAILATGVDNLTIDNLLIDTNRDGIDIDCCRNVRISNCSVNSPFDDAICPKSSFALGYARPTENVTISNCYVTGAYEVGTVLDGSWKRWPSDKVQQAKVLPYFPEEFNGSIKLGTESNGGFKNIAISNCVFDGSKGFALESSDGAIVEDITFTAITMRDCTNTPLFLRLGSRMRGPKGAEVGTMRRIILGDITCSNSVSRLGGGGIMAGIPGHPIEDIKIHDVYLEYRGAGTKEMAALNPPEAAEDSPYPDPDMFGDIPASGFFLRHVSNVEFTNVEIAFQQPDARPVFWMDRVQGADLFRIRTPRVLSGPVFALHDVRDFRVAASRNVSDVYLDRVEQQQL
ncbi:MAG: glycoside hydrolase family 28 protein [Candidatus Sulfotelmatobacter sp.]|jgi:polygalacturonase